METKFDKVYLERSSIFELRNIGRDIGVRCPTSKSKDQLVSEIMDIIMGVKEPYTTPVRRGRPPRSSDNNAQTEILNTIAPTRWYDNEIIDEQSQYESLSNFIRQYQKDVGETYGKQNEIDILGYLDLIDNYGYVHDKNDYSFTKVIYFPDNKIKENNLRKGDLIYARGKVIHPNRPTFLTKIFEINDGSSSTPRQIFENMEIGAHRQEFKVFAELIRDKELSKLFPLTQGSRSILISKDSTKSLYELSKIFSRLNNTKVVMMSVMGLPECRSFLKEEENMEIFFTQFDRSPKETMVDISLSIERVKRLAELGSDVVFIIDGLEKVVKCCNSSVDTKLDATQCLKNIYALARVLKNSSVTVIGSANGIDLDPIQEISMISNVIK